jgi:glutathione S-transferase
MIELYHAGLTACSKKVRLCLREKGIDYVSHFVDLGKFEQHDPAYLKINPNGLVPTLVHDGVPIVESTVINEYLDDVFPDVPLRPADPVARARMRVWNKLADEALGPNMVFAFSGASSIGEAARGIQEAEIDATLARIPLIERRNAIEKIRRRGSFSEEEFAAAREKAGFIVRRAEQSLESGPYLAGESLSLADINMIPFIDRYRERVVPDLFTAEIAPRLCDWHARIMARPAAIATWEPSAETRPAAT